MNFNHIKAGDIIRFYIVFENEERVKRITDTYIITEAGEKFRRDNGRGVGRMKGYSILGTGKMEESQKYYNSLF